MNSLRTFFIIGFILSGYLVNAQLTVNAAVSIASDGTDPHESAMLHVKSSAKGFLTPRMTTAERVGISNPAVGLLVFDTDTRTFWYRKLFSWKELEQEDVSFITDSDNDTRVEVEFTPDDDLIRFAVGGTLIMQHNGRNLAMLNNGNSLFIGTNAGNNDDLSNNWNAFLGNYAGRYNTTGSNNTAIGNYALAGNTSGVENIAIGESSFYNSDTGNYNVVVGHEADYYNPGGSKNTVIGYQAGYGLGHSKRGNVLIGYKAGYHETGSNKLYIDNSNTSTPLIYGEFNNNLLRVNGTLDINNSYYFPLSDGQAGESLRTNGYGMLTWSQSAGTTLIDTDNDTKVEVEKNPDDDIITFTTEGAVRMQIKGKALEMVNTNNGVYIGTNAGLNDISSANVFIGNGTARYNTTGENNTAIGSATFVFNETSSYNTAIGYRAMQWHQNGDQNTAIGANALSSDTSGINNTAIGYQSMNDNRSGSYNVAVGHAVLQTNLTGANNTAIGTSALFSNTSGSRNVAMGYSALQNNTTGNENLALGSQALSSNTSGEYNTAVGYKALYQNSIGIRNTTVGYYALENNTTGNDNIAIGNMALRSNTTGIENIAIGDSALYSSVIINDNIAIGINSLKNNVTGNDNTVIGNNSGMNTNNFGNTAIGSHSLNANIGGYNNTALGKASGPSYDGLINTTCVGYGAQVYGSNEVRLGNWFVTWIGGYASWSVLSDGRFQQNIRENVEGLDFILKLRPVTFNYQMQKHVEFVGKEIEDYEMKDCKEKEKIVYSGFIAQEVEKTANEIGYDFSGIDAPKSDLGHYSLRYSEFVVPIVKAMQEQQGQIEALEELVISLQNEIEVLRGSK